MSVVCSFHDVKKDIKYEDFCKGIKESYMDKFEFCILFSSLSNKEIENLLKIWNEKDIIPKKNILTDNFTGLLFVE